MTIFTKEIGHVGNHKFDLSLIYILQMAVNTTVLN